MFVVFRRSQYFDIYANININHIHNSKNIKIIFIPEEKEINKFIYNIKIFGEIKSINTYLNSSSIIKDDINSHILINKWIEESINKKEIKFKLIFKI